MQLKALKSTSAASTPSNAETPQKNVQRSKKNMTYANVDHDTEVPIEGVAYYNVSEAKSDEHDGNMTDENIDHDTEVQIVGDTYYNVSDKKSDEHDGSDQHFYEMDEPGQAYEKLSSGKQVEQMYTPLNPNLI